MASTITISFTTQALDFGPLTRGAVTIKYNDGLTTHNLVENLVIPPPGVYQFQEVPWVSGLDASTGYGQAINFANAFNRDYKNVGSAIPKNLQANVSGNVVTITARSGTFPSGSSYSGNVLIVSIGTPVNDDTPPDPLLTATATNDGDCTVIEYETVADLGTPPYTLTRNSIVIQTGWDGSAQNVAMVRGQLAKIFVTDDDGLLSNAITINVSAKIVSSQFEVSTIPSIGFATVVITDTNPIVGITPLEYSIDDTAETTGQNYQLSNSFPGVLTGTYKLFIKDKFGCEVSKTIVINTATTDPVGGDVPRTFIVSDFNSLSFSKQDNGRKNYLNTLSFQENVGLRKQVFFRFLATDEIQTQFKSSYFFHVITLFKCDGTKEELPFIQTQENIGTIEKVDCKLFPVDGLIGVYFAGGNVYTPGTTTVIDGSPYINALPPWAEIGQFVSIDGVGVKEIEGIGYDSDLSKMYFTVAGTISAAADDKIQVTYNRHNYNVYRVDFPMSKVSNKAFVRIEAGYSFDEIDQTWQSETIKRLSEEESNNGKYIQLKWYGFKTLGDMIFIDGIQGVMWVRGRVRPFPVSESETYDGSDQTYSLEQVARMGQKVTIPLMTPKQWNKFNLVSGITQGGVLTIEDMELVRTSSIEVEEIGETNYSNVSCEFAYSGNGLNIEANEIILNPSTGVEGTGGTGKDPIIGWQGFKRLQFADGTFIRLEGDTFVSLV